jgi:hypothetical protein
VASDVFFVHRYNFRYAYIHASTKSLATIVPDVSDLATTSLDMARAKKSGRKKPVKHHRKKSGKRKVTTGGGFRKAAARKAPRHHRQGLSLRNVAAGADAIFPARSFR